MNKKIITIAGIVFALIFVVLLAIMMGTITNKTNSANTKLVDTLEMSDGMDLANYENTMIKGSSVENAIKNGKSLGGNLKLFFYVETGEGSEEVYGYGTKSGSAMSGLKMSDGSSFNKSVARSNVYKSYGQNDSTKKDYINESAEFNSYTIKNENNVTVGLYLKQN